MPSENVVEWYGGVVQVAPASEVNYISTLRQLLWQSSSPGRCGVTFSDCCCGSRDVAASHSQTAVAAAGTLRRHISDCCCGSRDVAASHSHTAVAAAETLRRHSGKLLLRQQGRCQWWLLRISSCGDRSAALAMKLHRFEEVPDIASVFGGSQVVFAKAVVNPPLFQRCGCLRRDRQAAWRPGALRVGLEHSELTSVAQDSVTFEENLKGTVQTGGVHRRLRALRCFSVETAPSGGRAVRKSIKPLSR